MTRPSVLTVRSDGQLRELLARTLHDANTGPMTVQDDPTRYGAMADAVMAELAPLLDEYRDGIRRLVAFPHPDAIPEWWRAGSGSDAPITLTDVVDVLWRHVEANSVGAPAPSPPEGQR